MRIAIVGAGIAGLSCAETLQAIGHDVSLFDKSRGAGGRMATRRVSFASGEIAFDHGAQYFTTRDPEFMAAVRQWEARGIVARWASAGQDAWVGTPGMNEVARDIARTLTIEWQSKVDTIRRVGQHWVLDPVSEEVFDAVIIAIPADQATSMLAAHDPAMTAIARSCVSAPCWTAMVAFDESVAIATDIVRNRNSIAWAARNSAKPGRSGPEAWVIQATETWSRQHLEEAEGSVVDALLAALSIEASEPLPEPIVRIGHRWRYARATAADYGSLWNDTIRIGAIGDWLIGPRIESAWLSGRNLARRISNAGV